MSRYDEGYENGESSVTADIEFCITERLGIEMDEDETWSVPLLRLKQECDRYRDALEWIYARPEDPETVQQRARKALDGGSA